MKDIDELTEEDAQCSEYDAHLFLAENDKGKEYYFVKDIHWIRKYKQEKKKEIAQHKIPIQTKFRRVPSSVNHPDAETMLKALKTQRDYWQEQLNKKIADHINNATNMEASKKERKVNTKSGFRYRQRVEACEHFIEKLEEHIEERQ